MRKSNQKDTALSQLHEASKRSSQDDEDFVSIGQKARAASHGLAVASTKQKDAALIAMAFAIRASKDHLMHENAFDVQDMQTSGGAASFVDRLTLTEDRIEAMAAGLEAIAKLDDPIGFVADEWTRPNGLQIKRVRTPLGVIGVVYESRPNVTADAGALTLKAGNAVILRGGSDSFRSSTAIHKALVDGLKEAGLPEAAIQMMPTRDRAAVGAMLSGLGGAIDVIVPRGGKGLVGRVQEEARVPVFAHLEGICHLYIHEKADVQMATDIAVNAKMRRTGICGAAETLLIDRSILESHLKPIADALQASGCALRGDEDVARSLDNVALASEEDWTTEYLAPLISIRVVDGLDQAIAHIAQYGSSHTESIITDDADIARAFQTRVDSAIVMHNASTQFADGAEFGMGAEIGIATGRMHARGPIGVEQLTSFKYLVCGSGQVRP